MNETYVNALAVHGASLIKYIGLVNASGVELSGGTYARKAVTWGTPNNGTIRPTADITFNVPTGATVAGWRGFSEISGGTNYGGADLAQETYTNAGEYKIIAASTGIRHDVAS